MICFLILFQQYSEQAINATQKHCNAQYRQILSAPQKQPCHHKHPSVSFPKPIRKLRLPCHPTLLLPSYSAQTSYLLPAYRPVLHTQISLFYVPSMPYIYNLPGCTDIEISGIKFHSHRILSFYVPFLRRDLHSCSHHFGQTDFYHTPALLLYSLTLTSLFCISCTLIARMTGTSF